MKNLLEKFGFKNWEAGLLVVAGSLFTVSAGIYLSGYPLQDLLFGLSADSSHEAIGKITHKDGSLRRELLGQSEFKSINSNESLYPRDVIVTGSDGRATVTLDDGSVIEMAPGTMIRLEGETHRGLDGISRITRVQVVSGEVKGKSGTDAKSKLVILAHDEEINVKGESETVKAGGSDQPMKVKNPVEVALNKPEPIKQLPSPRPAPPAPAPSPSPSPSPLPPVVATEPSVIVTAPKPNLKYTVAQGSQTPIAIIPIHLAQSEYGQKSLAGKPAPIIVRVYKQMGKDEEPRLALEQKLAVPARNQMILRFPAKSPGPYSIEVTREDLPQDSEKENPAATTRFTVLPEFVGIELRQPESFTEKGGDEEVHRPKVKLTWKPYDGATSYRVQISRPGKPMEEAEVNGTEYAVKRTDILDTERHYQVSAKLPSGWLVKSSTDQFVFDFTPPSPVTPANNRVLGANDNLWDGNGILLTWQKTGISDAYVIQIAADPSFSKVLVKRQQTDNFLIFKPANRDLTYYWHVQAVASGALSRPSETFQFSVKRQTGGTTARVAAHRIAAPASVPQRAPLPGTR